MVARGSVMPLPLLGGLILFGVQLCTATNILFILADDLGYGDVQTYPNPSSPHGRMATPRLQKLTEESMMFTDAYTGAPVCAPSRCALMTGKHLGHCTVRSNGPELNSSDVTVAHVLKNAGYHTALIGKWGLGSNGTVASPNNKGFDFFYGYTSQENAHDYYPPFLWRDMEHEVIAKNMNASRKTCGNPFTTNCVWAEDLFINETLALLREHKNAERDFYIFLAFTTPHAGDVGSNKETGVPAPDEGIYADKSWPDVEKHFASCVHKQDAHVGQVLDALDELGLAKDTVVFYASDNGAHNEGTHSYQFFESSGPLRGFKRSLHEGGIRSPLLVRWPDVVKPGTTSPQRWAFYDFMATAADIANVSSSDLPANDGYSFVPTLKGQAQPQPDFIYHEYCAPNEDKKGWGQSVVIEPHWKAVRYDYNATSLELYNLMEDLGETKDVASENPTVVQQITKIMSQQHVDGNYCHGH
ncbi:steryl-sulfatase-like [Sycon ciliatum]|uniref:steryl-sulfatase-like n=1 Tax=Sycon ciliatum TaxID=27933 RepID=UPI0031F68FC4